MTECLIIASIGKKGHERQAVAVARRLGLSTAIVAATDTSPTPAVPPATQLVIGAGRQAIRPSRAIAHGSNPSRAIAHGSDVRPLVVVLQPVPRPSDFDLVWAPRHDRGFLSRVFSAGSKRIETLTAPSAVTLDEREKGAALLAGRLAPGRAVGVLVGGTSVAHRFDVPEAIALGGRIAAFGAMHGVTLLVTTSRRTGEAQTAALAGRLAGTRHYLVDGSGPDASLAYAGILEAAVAFIVTSDSIAMLSDAALTGKPIYGWRLPGGKAKFERFYTGLQTHGAMRWFDGGLGSWTYAPLDAAEVIAGVLRPRLGLLNAALQHK